MPQQKRKGPRKIEKSETGRVYWKPGKAHPLDVLYEEVDQIKAQLPGLLEELLSTAQQTTIRLNGMLEAARESNDLAALFSEADRQAHHLIVDRFHNRKHYDHLHAAFTLQRYKRLIGRLKTIQAALNLASDLLGAEETLSQEFLTTWRNSQQEEPQEEEPKEAQPETQLTIEEMRLQGLDEPLADIVSSVDQSRQFLRNFEAHLPELRRQLSRGQGWIEVFYVPKRHYKPEVIAYAKALRALQRKKIPIPPEVEQAVHLEVKRLIQAGAEKFPLELREEVYDITKVGPYAKYRWVEDGQTYTISLGLIDDYPPYPFVPEGF
jgi:hypothetical protein